MNEWSCLKFPFFYVAILIFDNVRGTKCKLLTLINGHVRCTWLQLVIIFSFNFLYDITTSTLLFFSLGSGIQVSRPFCNEIVSWGIYQNYNLFTRFRVHISFCFIVPPLSFLVVSELECSVLERRGIYNRRGQALEVERVMI